jgi:hypothetical protein
VEGANNLWEHQYDSTPPTSVTQHIQLSVFPHRKTPIHATNQTATISPSYITATLSPISLQTGLFGATSMGNRSTSHGYQLCQLTNGRQGWTADQYKRGQFSKL